MKKIFLILFVVALILAGCGGQGHGKYYKQVSPEVGEILSDAHETIQLHMDGKMGDYEAETRLTSMSEKLDGMELNGVEDSAKTYIDLAVLEVGSGETAIDYLHDLEDYL